MNRYRVVIWDWNFARGMSFDLGEPGPARLELMQAALNEDAYVTYDLEAENPGRVFELLNIEHPADYRHRSLSVGDLVIDVNKHNLVHVVERCGWSTIELPIGDGYLPPARTKSGLEFRYPNCT